MRHELALSTGKTIARWRTAKAMTQEQLALALDVDPMTVSRFERGVTLPSLTTLHRIAEVFGVPLSKLFENAPQAKKRNDADVLNVLIGQLSATERAFVVETVKRFCTLKKRKK